MKKIKLKKLSSTSAQCVLCEANFEVWLGNQRLIEGREEKMREKLLIYCPACAKADSANKHGKI